MLPFLGPVARKVSLSAAQNIDRRWIHESLLKQAVSTFLSVKGPSEVKNISSVEPFLLTRGFFDDARRLQPITAHHFEGFSGTPEVHEYRRRRPVEAVAHYNI